MDQNRRLPVLQSDDTVKGTFFNSYLFIEWIQQNGKLFLYGLFALMALIFFLTQLIDRHQTESRQAFIHAEQELTHYRQEGKLESLKALQALILTHPALEQKYDALVAQAWIEREEASAAEPYTQAAFKQTRNDHLPFYRHFAKTTLLIAQGQEEAALKQSLTLKEELQQLAKKGERQADVLYTFNLLRIGTLQQQLGQQKESKASFQELLNASKVTSSQAYPYPSVVQGILAEVKEGGLTLESYLSLK